MLPSFRSVLLFTVASLTGIPALGAPTIAIPSVNPSSLTVGLSTQVTASCQVSTVATDPALLPGGVDLVRLTATGTAVSTLGVMHDDGLNGDAQAGDGIFTLQFTTNESAAGQFELQCTAAFKGLLQRIKSPAATVTVLPGAGTLAVPTISPASVPYGTPTSVTITAAVTGATPDSGSVMLQRLDSSGRVLAILGGLHDDGLDGDAVPGDGIFTLVITFTEFAVGTVPLRVSATFSGAVSHVFSPIATLTVTGTPPPTVTISAPTNLSYLSLSPTTVNGTVSDPQATVVINSIPAAVSNGVFSASIPLAEGPNILTATATAPSGSVGTASIQVNLDTTPPHVTITSPADQFVTSSSTFSIAGNVNDIVVGTVNSQQVHVTVNGVAAQVGNRTFLAQNIPLSLGPNVIQAVAVDQAGNSATTQITVTRQAPQPGQIQVVSGNNQTATIGSVLPAPLVVTLTDSTGNPAANKPVIFSVTQNNGMLSSNGSAPAASVLANTNAQGQATVNWTLGMRAGAGSDGVQAYSVGFGGTAVFTATANQGTPGMIVVDSGNNQTGAVNQQLPKPLVAVVVDAGHNRLAGVPVTFIALQGGGSFAGQPTVTVSTDSDGRVAVSPTLGFQEGNSNNVFSADFPGDVAFPAAFTASGLGPGPPGMTVIAGLVLDNSNQPVAGVTVRALLTNVLTSSAAATQSAPTSATDANGRFSIYGAPVGYVKLLVDGTTATTTGTFPTLEYDMVTVPGQINTAGQTIYLVPIKTNNQLCVTANTGGGTLTIPDAPGFSLTFGPGQVTFPGGSKTGCVSVTSVHPDKVPMAPGFGQQPRFIVTIQPSGALFNPPAPITLPNVDGLSARQVTEMYSFDHDIGSFVAIGTGTVSDDGMTIRSNSGIGVLKAGWHCGGDPNARGTAADCPACQFCQGPNANSLSCVAYPGGIGTSCSPQGNPCLVGTCGGTMGTGSSPNMPTGTCDNLHPAPDGTPCGTGGSPAVCRAGFCVGNTNQCSCNSGSPCVDESCGTNNSCVGTPNPLCQRACNGRTTGACDVANVAGTCDSAGDCNLCASLGAGASCPSGGTTSGTCDSSGHCKGSDGQCPSSCTPTDVCMDATCTDGSCGPATPVPNSQTKPCGNGGICIDGSCHSYSVTGILTPDDSFNNRSTTDFGVGELIHLGFTSSPLASASQLGGLQWQVDTAFATNLVAPAADGTGNFYAPSSAASVSLQLVYASGPNQGQAAFSTTINVVEPSASSYWTQQPNTGIEHCTGSAFTTVLTYVHLLPSNVSFKNIKTVEGQAYSQADGVFASRGYNNDPHCTSGRPCSPQSPAIIQEAGQGYTVGDTLSTPDLKSPFGQSGVTSTFIWDIPWSFTVGNLPPKTFIPKVRHKATISTLADGSATVCIQKDSLGPLCFNSNDPNSPLLPGVPASCSEP